MRLNLGCGTDLRPHSEDWINVANCIPKGYEANPKPSRRDYVVSLYEEETVAGISYGFSLVDLDETPWPWGDDSARYILASHVLEHLDDVTAFMDEAHRVLGPGGILEIRVPHWQHPNAHQDPTHQHTFTWGSMDYFLETCPEDLHPLGEGRWSLVMRQKTMSWDHVPTRWRHWARRLNRWLGIPRSRWQELTWELTPAPRCGIDA